MPVQFALLGAGRIGNVHANAIGTNSEANLATVFDPIEASARSIAEKYGCNIKKVAEIAADSTIDAVVICTPTDTHPNLIELFARAEKAVFCEKPIALDLGRVRGCMKTIDDTKVPFMIGFNRRFDPHFAAVRDSIDSGKIGTVEMVQIISRDPEAPPAKYIKYSGGIFRDMTIHDFDMARFLLGEEPNKVFATGAVLTDPKIAELGDFDSANVLLTTKSGRQCSISNSRRAAYGYDQRIEVHGSEGAISAENQRPVSIELATSIGYTKPALHHFFMTRYMEAYAAEIRYFIKCLKDGTIPEPDISDGYSALLLAEAAVKSVAEGRLVDTAEI